MKALPLSLANLRGKLLLSLFFGLLIVAGLLAYADFSQLLDALGRFRWSYVPAILGLTLVNYTLRFVKWDYYLRQIGVTGLTKRNSLFVFFSGLSMVITPGKVGEWLKCYLLGRVSPTPFSRSAPIIIAERLSDGIAMVLLAAGGLLLFRLGWPIVVVVLLLASTVVVAARHRPLAERGLAIMARFPILSSRMPQLRAFYESSHILLSPRNLLFAISLGFVSWLSECVAFYLVLLGFGLEGGGLLLLKATFILATSSLGGSILLIPGGLGVAEGGITGLSQVLLAMPKAPAAAAALIIRFCTLWFGVTLGMVMLFFTLRRLAASDEAIVAEGSTYGLERTATND